MNPILELNLAGTWDFTPENGQPTTIQVPGGGWLKQGFHCEAGVYQRTITIPAAGGPQVTRLELGAVNHHAEYWIGKDGASLQRVAEEVTAFTPQVVDLTPHVQPGETYLLRIAVRAWKDGRPIAPHWAEWCECIARGIFRSAHLRVYPQVYISDAFVRTSVAGRALSYDVWVSNASDRERTVALTGRLASWNHSHWPYPTLPPASVRVPAGETVRVTVGPVEWALGPASYWWPNVPYRPGYRAQLHWLQLALAEEGQTLHSAQVRFGFRESRQQGPCFTLNGVHINYRGDNLQVANYDRIDCGGRGDAIDTLPGFLPPSEANPGWPRAVDNFLRLNYNVQRTHMGPWSPYMLDVCDEMGLLLIGESAARWNGFDMENGRGYHEVKCLQDIIRRDRNHPSIVRWSSKNEPQCLEPAYHVELYEAIKALDDTRPISEDIVIFDRAAYDVNRVYAPLLDKDDFTWIEHYLSADAQGRPYSTPHEHNDALVPLPGRPYGMGEADWMRSSTPAGLAWFATTTALDRALGASDVRPYVLLGSWASSIPGVRTGDLLTEENRHPVYGEDNLSDPWAHPGIRALQEACHPNLALDYDFWWANRRSDAWGHFPTVAPTLQAGAEVTREITVFNDELSGPDLELAWALREGNLACRPLAQGQVRLHIEPGERGKAPVTFRAPKWNTVIFLTLRVYKAGAERFRSELTCFEVVGGVHFSSEFNGEERTFI